MRLLMLTPYPPMHGGISAYADQEVAGLRAEGHEVAVASPVPSRAEHVIDVRKRRNGRRLVKLARRHERLIVQFHPEMLGDPGTPRRSRAAALVRLGIGMAAARECEVCVHEVDYGAGLLAPLLRAAARCVWRHADVLTVHTEQERRDFARAFRIRDDRIRVVSQGAYMWRRTDTDKATARTALDLPAGPTVFVAIGFLQPNKGFDRAIRAFAGLRPEDARLYVVGSKWRHDQAMSDHVADLRRLARTTPGVELREGYLEDDEFDEWIVAADALVLPYRQSWSSNVMERGLLYERPVIVARVGGMAEQGSERAHVTLVDDDDELRAVLRSAVHAPAIH
jgi:glycosyltransferase involved in cell wall biosynthesis